MNKRILGDSEEKIVVDYLKDNNYTVIERNYRCRCGEIDIVGENDGYLVFIEVKYRKNATFGSPAQAVGKKKQAVIYKTAEVYLKQHKISFDCPVRFDVVSVLGNRISIIKNAFGGM